MRSLREIIELPYEFLKGDSQVKKIFAAFIGLTAAAAIFASCSGNTEDSSSLRDGAGTTVTTTTASDTETTTRRTTERDDSSRSLMSQAESKLDELGDDVADGIDTTLSTAGEVADDILR